MPPKHHLAISQEVADVLKRSTIYGRNLTLPEQLPRPLYNAVDKILKARGGKWNRAHKMHTFPADVQEIFAEALKTGTIVKEKQLLQAFYSPPAVAKRVVELLGYFDSRSRILEPSAGGGALIDALLELPDFHGEIVLVELDARAFLKLTSKYDREPCLARGMCRDFLELDPESKDAPSDRDRVGYFDVVVMNPPFDRGQADKHFLHAWKFLKAGGKIACVMPANAMDENRRGEDARMLRYAATENSESYGFFPLPEGSFSESGTKIDTGVLVVEKW